MSADLALLGALLAFFGMGFAVGTGVGWDRAERLWRNRNREQRRALIDAHRRLAVFEERERDAHERCRLTPDEHERFIQIAEREDDR